MVRHTGVCATGLKATLSEILGCLGTASMAGVFGAQAVKSLKMKAGMKWAHRGQ
jgi:hypothetical protein